MQAGGAGGGAGGAVVKLEFKLKSHPKGGEILQLHHTVRGSAGEVRRIRFVTATFNDANERLACADVNGNIFILDFSDLNFWKLSQIGPCSAMHFMPEKVDTLLVCNLNKSFDINFVDIETAAISRKLTGHTTPVKHISFSSPKVSNLLTGSATEAIIWELKNFTKYFTLNTHKGALIQQIMFTPVCDHLVACFQNNTVQIWKHDTLKTVKQIIPSDLKHMKSIAFTMNGRAMVMTGLTPTMILFSLDTWKAIKSIDLSKYNISGVRQVAFIPQMFDGGSNKILAILSSDCLLHIFDIETLTILHTVSPVSSLIKRMVVRPTGKYFVCILQMGEVNVYNASQVIELVNKAKGDNSVQKKSPVGTELKKIFSRHKHDAENEVKMKSCLDGARLRRILTEYAEYPAQYRSIIWRALLNTPKNKNAYISLVNKPIHTSYKDIEKQFTIHSAVTMKNLKRLLSCLAHWCPLFGVMRFIPGFVFPFVRVLQKDPLLLFESVASILINYCQLWFEYAPFPPINILAMIENVLAEHDQSLLEHFCKHGITNQIYALKILETAFSEVLISTEWLILWDHILSNEPAFILMAVVSYNIVQRNAIKKLATLDEFEDFYHMQNALDMKSFLKKCYSLLNSTSEDIHPRKFLNPYTAMDKGSSYPQFVGYPKATVCLKLAERERKKAMKSQKKESLKELTKNSQEKELNVRYFNKDEVSSDSDSKKYSDSEEEPCYSDEEPIMLENKKINSKGNIEANNIKHKGNRSFENLHNESITKLQLREELEMNKLNPQSSGYANTDLDLEKEPSCLSNGSRKKKIKKKHNDEIEKEIDKLMKKLSQSKL